jgi:hypothetical protein
MFVDSTDNDFVCILLNNIAHYVYFAPIKGRMIEVGIFMKGHVVSEETRRKISRGHKGKSNGREGCHLSDETRRKISESNKGKTHGPRGELHWQWAGDTVGKVSLHIWIRRYKPKSEVCEMCHQKKPLDAANISGEYRRDINDFIWLCRACHSRFDDQITKAWITRRKAKKINGGGLSLVVE